MFANEAQRSLVCCILTDRLPGGANRWFAADKHGIIRPTDETWDAIEKGSPMSSGEALMLRAAVDVWNGSGKLELGRTLDTLDGRSLRLLGSFLVAYGSGSHAIAEWILEHNES